MEPNNSNENKVVNSGSQGYASFLWELLKIAIIALVIVLPIRYFLFQPFIVKGESMSPNFESGDYLIIDEITYRFSGPERGDVIVFRYPKDETQRFIKRVVGLPGEKVEVSGGQVKVTGKDGNTWTLQEKYLPQNLKTTGDVSAELKEGEFFVMGDNRDRSYDSREWGILPQKDIIGRAFFRVFPLSELSKISQPTY